MRLRQNQNIICLFFVVLTSNSLMHGMNQDVDTFISGIIETPVEQFVTQSINAYIDGSKDKGGIITTFEYYLNILSMENVPKARQAYKALVTQLVAALQNKKTYKKIMKNMPERESFFKMILRFYYAKTKRKNLDDVDCYEFLRNPNTYVSYYSTEPSEINLLTQKYLKYVLPIMSFFIEQDVIIEKLNLSCKGFVTVPSEILQITTLKVLDLRGNQLSKTPENIHLLEHLEELDLSSNCLKEFPKNVEKLVFLKKLVLRGNRLNKLPEDWKFPRLLYLRLIDVSRNELSEFSFFDAVGDVVNVITEEH